MEWITTLNIIVLIRGVMKSVFVGFDINRQPQNVQPQKIARKLKFRILETGVRTSSIHKPPGFSRFYCDVYIENPRWTTNNISP